MSSLLDSLAGFVVIDAFERTATLQELLRRPLNTIPDNVHRARPEEYVRDIVRFTLHVGKRSFFCGKQEEPLALQQIDNAMLGLINELDSCPLAQTTAGVHTIRYLLQDLLKADLFVLDPNFPTRYTHETYVPKGELPFPLKESEENGKESCFSVSRDSSTLIISAVQYFKIAKALNPTKVTGYDALKIVVRVDLTNATQESVVGCFDSALCHLRFHGFCKTLDALAATEGRE
ncbi:MAG: hypothetical protein JSR37_01130 [Verrucomicrobia bacterium]|nr:hypothetical protein [Verrucomicrobiota bacterium]MBS0637608.1 hypothetical protein [Verrucomicrobiota bacterium]